MEMFRLTEIGILSGALLLLIGCDSSSSSNTAPTPPPSPPVVSNVAAVASGGVADATYNVGNAPLVNDGVTTAGTHWIGNIPNDEVTVEFDAVYNITKIVLHTNKTNGQDTIVITSVNGTDWVDVPYTGSGVGSHCNNFSMSGTDQIVECGFIPPRALQAVGFRMVTNPSTEVTEIREIEAFGY